MSIEYVNKFRITHIPYAVMTSHLLISELDPKLCTYVTVTQYKLHTGQWNVHSVHSTLHLIVECTLILQGKVLLLLDSTLHL